VFQHTFTAIVFPCATRRPKGRRDALENGLTEEENSSTYTRMSERNGSEGDEEARERKRSRFERERRFGSRASGVTLSRLRDHSIVARETHALPRRFSDSMNFPRRERAVSDDSAVRLFTRGTAPSRKSHERFSRATARSSRGRRPRLRSP